MRLLRNVWPFGRKKRQTTRDIGAAHEHDAAAWLTGQGYAVEAVNYRTRLGEIDIIARRNALIVFVEVRYRSSTEYGLPQETVTATKQQRIAKAALSYLKMHRLTGVDVRFDVIAVSGSGVIEHIPSAFVPRGYWY